jgi:Flp pilus assembly protein TadD
LWLTAEIEISCDGLDAVRERMGRMAKIPSKPPVYAEIYASLCRRAGIGDAAVEQYEKLQTRGDASRAIRQKAFILAKSGRENEAIGLMEELLRADLKDHFLHSAYGAACGRAGELDRAKSFYRELMDANPAEKGLYGRIRAIDKKIAEHIATQKSKEPDGTH